MTRRLYALQPAPADSPDCPRIEEWRPRDGVYREWQQLTDRDLNRMTFEQMNEGGDGWGIDLQLYLHSTMVPQYNPLTEFLNGCGRWYGHKDHIAELAKRVPTDYADWEPLFHCWFLAIVAQWLGVNKRFSNMLVPMLIGGQGTHKTTFCRMPTLSELSTALAYHFQTGAVKGRRGWYMRIRQL